MSLMNVVSVYWFWQHHYNTAAGFLKHKAQTLSPTGQVTRALWKCIYSELKLSDGVGRAAVPNLHASAWVSDQVMVMLVIPAILIAEMEHSACHLFA